MFTPPHKWRFLSPNGRHEIELRKYGAPRRALSPGNEKTYSHDCSSIGAELTQARCRDAGCHGRQSGFSLSYHCSRLGLLFSKIGSNRSGRKVLNTTTLSMRCMSSGGGLEIISHSTLPL